MKIPVEKHADTTLGSIVSKAILLCQWADELTTFQKYLIQEVEDVLQEVIDQARGTE